MKRRVRLFTFILAAALPLYSAGAATSLQFNNNANNVVGGTLDTLNLTTGQTFILSLQLNSTVAANAVDFWLSQFSGPAAGAFTILSANYTGSSFSDPSFTGSFSGDAYNNTTGAGGADGVIDGLIKPRNGPDLGSTTTSGADVTAGTSQIVTLTLQVNGTAALGLYQLRSFSYPGTGFSSTTVADQPYSNQAAINVNVVPEPSSVALLVLGGAAVLGLGLRGRLGRA
ncbi:MAG: PEP-CTERM sorting domain-containing protein [Verrucomicrobiota bacterium]|nr:PEP-CTERM sorting domain-containing protein [Verrucomicrobiota bacterium]